MRFKPSTAESRTTRDATRARSTADRWLSFEHEHFAARLRNYDRRSQAIRPRADDDGICRCHMLSIRLACFSPRDT